MIGCFLGFTLLSVGSGCEAAKPKKWPCVVHQGFPYPDGIPYVGVHANPSNNDCVPCRTAPDFRQEWHALQGFAIGQPNTFSPDGTVTYVTTSQPAPGECNLYALSTTDGQVLWCRAYDTPTMFSSVEVDLNGALYLTIGGAIVSLDPAGNTRWEVEVTDASGLPVGAVGLHFTPQGHIATITEVGTVMLIERSSGDVLASLDIPAVYGFVPPRSLGSHIDLAELLPPVVLDDFASLEYGEPTSLAGVFSGAGNFSDNTVGVAPNGDLYTIGGGPTPDVGALVQIEAGGTADAPTLTPGWAVLLNGSSATSPGISPDGRYVKFCDGSSPGSFLMPQTAEARARLVDIAACDGNTDIDPDPSRCAEAYAVDLLSGPIMGASPVLDGPVHYLFEVQVADLLNRDRPDVRAFQRDQLLWEIVLPDDLQWSSVITSTENHLIGTATRVTDSGETLLTVEIPGTAESFLILLDRETGAVVLRAPITDDSTSTVTVGPDGSLYVTMLCLLHTLSVDTRPIGGIIRFSPRQ